ncbi:MAG: hypothetical protein LDL41_04825 [Coleofasciculus sp. S288]|nr:hypothetical protein [Coleofasciculus sp. S288]
MQLRYEPTVETRNRKRTRPNSIAAWELRIAEFRVFYNVEEQVKLFFEGHRVFYGCILWAIALLF